MRTETTSRQTSIGKLTKGMLPCQMPFYNKISKAKQICDFLSFEHSISLTGLKALYIRYCYQVIASNILQRPNLYRGVVTGSEGMGTTFFLIYYLWRLVKEGKRVLFLYGLSKVYFDGKGGVFALSETPVRTEHLFWTKDLWCLMDSSRKLDEDFNLIPYEYCNFVLSSEPRRKLFNQFKLFNFDYSYIPLWSKEELSEIAPLFPESRDWLSRYEILGGAPQYVLQYTDMSAEHILKHAARSCDLNETIGFQSSITDQMEVQSLVHITSDAPFKESLVQFSSEAALDIFAKEKSNESKRNIKELLKASQLPFQPLVGPLCDKVILEYALQLLEEGGLFNYHQLAAKGEDAFNFEEMKLEIPPGDRIAVDRVAPNQTENQIYVPETNSHSSIDAWIPGIGAFKTKSYNPIKKETNGDLKLLGTANALYWLLLPDTYCSFTSETLYEIRQYAVEIPFPS